MENEAKQTQESVTQTPDELFDKAYAELAEGKEETPSAPSTEEKPEDKESSEEDASGTDQQKPDKAETDEEDVPKEFHKHPKWQKLRERAIEAEKRLMETQAKPEISKEELETFKRTIQSPEYIQASMRAQGYTDEAITGRLKELGHKVPEVSVGDVDLVLGKLNINKDALTQDQRDYVNTYVADAAKVADIIVRDRLDKLLPKYVEGIETEVKTMSQRASADKLYERMVDIVTTDGVLDYEADVAPELDKFMDANPKAQQTDIYNHFVQVNHRLALERLRLGKKQTERKEVKGRSRTNKEGLTLQPGKLPDKTGNPDKDLDMALTAMGVHT